MQLPLPAVVKQIHESLTRCAVILSGAGGSFISLLMSVPGCSKTLLDAQIPYSTSASQEILDYFPSHLVAPSVSRSFAQQAYKRAKVFADPGSPKTRVVGLGATAAVATNRQRRGADVVFASSWSAEKVVDYCIQLSKDRSREQQEKIVSMVLLKALADASEVVFEIPPGDLQDEETLQIKEYTSKANPIQAVLSGEIDCAIFNAHGIVRCALSPYVTEDHDYDCATYLLYPGSFQPLHYGHTELLRVAAEVVQRGEVQKKPTVCTYEIAASIVGKRTLQEADFTERIKQFTSTRARVAITSAKLFVQKARMFPHHGFVVGVDTARRVIDPKYYNDSKEQMLGALQEIAAQGCYFVVGGRKLGDAGWDDMSCMLIPNEIKFMFRAIKPEDFRVDISSTEIRARRLSAPSSPTSRPEDAQPSSMDFI